MKNNLTDLVIMSKIWATAKPFNANLTIQAFKSINLRLISAVP
jgi:hypothetical protein